jgi:hypothetical protein
MCSFKSFNHLERCYCSRDILGSAVRLAVSVKGPAIQGRYANLDPNPSGGWISHEGSEVGEDELNVVVHDCFLSVIRTGGL